jgi:hypothetical protein
VARTTQKGITHEELTMTTTARTTPTKRVAATAATESPAAIERSAPEPVSTRPKDRNPAFPARVLRFAKANNTAYELVLFAADTNEREYQGWLALNIGAKRVIRSAKDLAEVPMPILLDIFNKTRGDQPLDRFRDRETAENRVFEVLQKDDLYTPWTEKKLMAEAATKTEAKTKAEAKAKEKAEAKKIRDDKKQADKLAKDKAAKERSEGGVIGTIKSVLLSAKGGTIDEILETLTKKFPDRGADGMRSTVKIQTSRLKDKIGAIENAEIVGRGRVYKAKSAGEIPGKRVEKAAEPAATETKSADAKGAEKGATKAPEAAAAKPADKK